MVTNLPAEAKAKFVKYMEAKTPEEKLRALQEFLSSVPKHKGTENLLRWARKRLAELREEVEERRRKRTGGGGVSFFVEKTGAAQIVMLGFTNVGKSALLRALTGARAEVADYPYTTRRPIPGALKFEDIEFQIVEAPAIIPSGGGWNGRVIGLAKNADGLMLVIDASRDPIKQFEELHKFLKEHGIHIVKPRGYAVIEKGRGVQGIQIRLYGRLKCTVNDVKRLLESYRIYNAVVKIYGEVDLDLIEEAIFETITYKPSIVIVNKIDLVGKEALAELRRAVPSSIPIIPAAAARGLVDKKLIGRTIFDTLELIRVYTKPPLGKPSEKPLVLKRGSTILDVAKAVHSELYERFAYARIWGPSAKYPGQRVGLDHVVEDGDIVEINTRKK
ncbi:MAG: TGS domain-containing protein [Crenarchaeota archaeon]|nr:TGS domain-containing protein [Thermoproteota archaeon]